MAAISTKPDASGKTRRVECARKASPEDASGVEMVVIETCQNELFNCPNVLIETKEWKEAIEQWVKSSNVSRRLRQRIEGARVLYHQKFRIVIAGCPNACSRPQVADVGLIGFVRPDVDPAECFICGACEEVCPDRAITIEDGPPVFDRLACQGCTKCADVCPVRCIGLSEPGVRIMAGGKLGRRPRLGEVIGTAGEPFEVIEILERLIDEFVEHAKPDQRFSDFRGSWFNKKGDANE